MKMLRSKKAVSPLIATVLLIAFAVALGAVVMNWGRTYVEDTTENVRSSSDSKITCSMDIGLKLIKINGEPQVCYSGSGSSMNIDMTLENHKNKPIQDLQVTIIGSANIFSNTSILNDTFVAADMKKINFTYDNTTYGQIQLIKVVPKIRVEGELISCSDNALEISTINACS